MAERTIYGQAWIFCDKLMQEQTIFTENHDCYTKNVTLVDNIWDDLTSASGTYKYNNAKNYFYWEYDMTDSTNDEVTVKVQFECPKPTPELFDMPYNPDNVEGEYAKYWVKRMKIASDNYEKNIAIQKKDITLAGTSYIDQSGNIKTINDQVISNNDLGDITSLLNMF